MPDFAILLVSFNSRVYLERCLQRIRGQEGLRLGRELELVVIDNASTDGSRELLEKVCPEHLRAETKNFGFAGALNRGLAQTTAPWILSLNPDVLLAPDFFLAMQRRLAELGPPEDLGLLAPKLLRVPLAAFLEARTEGARELDSTGLFLDRMRRPYDRGQGSVDSGQFDSQEGILGPCGAAGLYRRSMLRQIAVNGEAFDERLFAYYEDIDLAWRARRAGFRALFVPAAIAWHVRASSDLVRSKPRDDSRTAIAARAHANRLLVLAKNERLRDFLTDLPWLGSYELARQLYVMLARPRLFWRALGHLRRDTLATLRKRRPAKPGVDLAPFVRQPRP